MSTNLFIRRAVRCALLSGAAAALAGLLPARRNSTAAGDSTIQEVVVTGSRIAQPNLTSVSPVTAVGSDQIKIEGVTRVEDLINNLPQAFADFGGNVSNGATGAATVNLRSLGSQRTLVLVNSRRLMPGDPTQNGAASPDLNQIPAALIERVEVLTGGASAVYGADAVAGVVNFIMNDKFEGVRVDAQYSLYQHDNNDADIRNLVRDARLQRACRTATYATATARTSRSSPASTRRTAAATPRSTSAIARSIRSRRTSATSARARSRVRRSSRVQLRRLRHDGAGAVPDLQPGRSERPDADRRLHRRRRRRSCATSQDTDQFNFAPQNYYQRPGRAQDRRPVRALRLQRQGQRLHRVHVHGRSHAGADRAERRVPRQRSRPAAVLRPLRGELRQPAALAVRGRRTFCGGNTGAGDVLLDIGRRNVEGGGRIDDLRHTSFRGVVGLRGDIADGWSYDVYGLYGTSILSENFQNDFSRTRLSKALNRRDRPERPAGLPRQRGRRPDERRSDLRALRRSSASAASRRTSSPTCRCPA